MIADYATERFCSDALVALPISNAQRLEFFQLVKNGIRVGHQQAFSDFKKQPIGRNPALGNGGLGGSQALRKVVDWRRVLG